MRMPDRVGAMRLERGRQPWPYPPLGFVAFAEHALGNGDAFGLYWPVGREGEEPIVAEMHHDDGTLLPVFSTLDAFLAAAEEGLDEDDPVDPPSLGDDPRSPLALLEAARNAACTGEPETAVALAERALAVLPEYGAALAFLASQQMRLDRFEAGWESALRMFRAPPCFSDPRAEAKVWRRFRAQAAVPDAVAGDPIWSHRHALRRPLGEGGKDVSGSAAMRAVIDAYRAAGETVSALLMIQTFAELMQGETVSFRERAGYDRDAWHGTALALSRCLPDGPRVIET